MAATHPAYPAEVEQLSSNKMFGSRNLRLRHQSATLGCPMTFSVYLPPSPASNVPVSATPLLPASRGRGLI
jgi:S-formylglutathione hydrolase